MLEYSGVLLFQFSHLIGFHCLGDPALSKRPVRHHAKLGNKNDSPTCVNNNSDIMKNEYK